jgi:hypothetical protein
MHILSIKAEVRKIQIKTNKEQIVTVARIGMMRNRM